MSNKFFSVNTLVFLSWTLLSPTGGNDLPPPCPSEIYCHGPLLHKIQMSKIFKDSKTFVDMKMKYSPNETFERFSKFMNDHGENPGYIDIYNFVNNTFDPAGAEFEDWLPSDWKESPKFLNDIHDPDFRDWGSKLNQIWKVLGRKMKNDVKENPDRYSIIWVPYPAIVPGGRFREFYYWDSYWIIKGLLLSEMTDTARGMLDNFLYIVDQYGFIPNGGRIYYSKRSQPPLLIPSIKVYYDHTEDLEYIRKNIAIMEKEFNFWMTNHTINITKNGKNYTLAVYGDKSKGPRPESYREDIHSAQIFPRPEDKEAHYSELKAAAESGWDFSSRWFISKDGDNEGNLTNLNTRYIVPVDLNSFLYENAVFLSEFHTLLNNTDKATYYGEIAKKWMTAVHEILWNDTVGSWLDYDIKNNKQRNYFYPSNLTPLYNGCYDPLKRDNIVRKVRKYLYNHKITSYKGGVPTSLYQTGEQWDWPNAWPPTQHMVIMGLDRTGDDYAQKIAFDIALTWVRSNFIAYNETGHMFEKYNSETPGGHGGGGEYEIQLGFGWSNGIIMDLLHKYGNNFQMRPNDPFPIIPTVSHVKEPSSVQKQVQENVTAIPSSASTFGQALAGLLILLVTIAVGFIGFNSIPLILP